MMKQDLKFFNNLISEYRLITNKKCVNEFIKSINKEIHCIRCNKKTLIQETFSRKHYFFLLFEASVVAMMIQYLKKKKELKIA